MAAEHEEAILASAHRHLERMPFNEISVDALIKGAGVSRATFYAHFHSKEQVLLALIDRITGDLEELVNAAVARVPENPQRWVMDGIEASARLWRRHSAVLRAAVETSAVDGNVQAVWHAAIQRFVDANAEMIRGERARGAAPARGPSPDDLAASLVLLNERTFYMTTLPSAPGPPDDRIVAVLLEIWLRAIYGRRDERVDARSGRLDQPLGA
jgi:AcrR family transcriptional regulator